MLFYVGCDLQAVDRRQQTVVQSPFVLPADSVSGHVVGAYQKHRGAMMCHDNEMLIIAD